MWLTAPMEATPISYTSNSLPTKYDIYHSPIDVLFKHLRGQNLSANILVAGDVNEDGGLT